MITSLQAFSKRFTDKQIGQRISFQLARRWFVKRYPEFLETDQREAVPVNGILVEVRRPLSRQLYQIQLRFTDFLIDGIPFPFRHIPRRRSRKVPKDNFVFIGVALADIVWPLDASTFAASAESTTDASSKAKQLGGFAQGMAGFLAGILPAPGTPPDDQKTPIVCPTSFDGSAAVERSNSSLSQSDTNANERSLYVEAIEVFRDLKTKLRRGRMTAEEGILYRALVSKLESGMAFPAVMQLLAGFISTVVEEEARVAASSR